MPCREVKNVSAKARDEHGRWRCQTIGIRISPEENAKINQLAALSGMTKQDYCINRMLQRDVVVVGNPRVHKALNNQMEQLYLEFSRLCSATEISPEILHVLEYMSKIYDGMKVASTSQSPTTKTRRK